MSNISEVNETSLSNFEQNTVLNTAAIVLSIIMIVGNGLVVVSVIRFKILQTITNVFVFSLALADFLLGICYMALIVSYIVFGDGLTIESGVYLGIAFQFFFLFSLLSLMAVSFERYFAILHPFWHIVQVTKRRCIISSVIIWVAVGVWTACGFVTLSLAFQKLDFHHFILISDICLAIVTILTLACVVITFVLYLRIRKTIHRHIADIKATSCDIRGSEDRFKGKETKRTTVIFVILVVFLISCLPFQTSHWLRKILYEDEEIPAWFGIASETAYIFQYFNSLINPIIYAGMNKDFRDSFKKLLLCTTSDKTRVGA